MSSNKRLKNSSSFPSQGIGASKVSVSIKSISLIAPVEIDHVRHSELISRSPSLSHSISE